MEQPYAQVLMLRSRTTSLSKPERHISLGLFRYSVIHRVVRALQGSLWDIFKWVTTAAWEINTTWVEAYVVTSASTLPSYDKWINKTSHNISRTFLNTRAAAQSDVIHSFIHSFPHMNTPWWAALSFYSSLDGDLVCIPASHCRRKTCWMSERCCICCFQPRSRTEEAASLPPSPFFQREPAPNSTIWMWAKWSSALNPPHCCVGTNLRSGAGGRRRRGQRRARAPRSARPLRARALRW